mmetsp:Transcript_26799/g.66703  ORF Transcript_26799/g.66703 Transcript_26799/m.66703 type:complete len:217 (+) Transcript_26799:35-685(+)
MRQRHTNIRTCTANGRMDEPAHFPSVDTRHRVHAAIPAIHRHIRTYKPSLLFTDDSSMLSCSSSLLPPACTPPPLATTSSTDTKRRSSRNMITNSSTIAARNTKTVLLKACSSVLGYGSTPQRVHALAHTAATHLNRPTTGAMMTPKALVCGGRSLCVSSTDGAPLEGSGGLVGVSGRMGDGRVVGGGARQAVATSMNTGRLMSRNSVTASDSILP